MTSHNQLRSVVRGIIRGQAQGIPPKAAPVPEKILDGVEDAAAAAAAAAAAEAEADKGDGGKNKGEKPVFDSANDPGSNYSDTDISLKAVAAVHAWAETDDLDEGEGLADRLLGLLVGIADYDLDGDIGDDEADVVEMAANAAWDYMSGKGVSDEDLSELFNEWDNDVAARIHELLISKLPNGDEENADDMDSFVFGDGSDESAFDSVVLDATYKKKIVVRKGKKVRINKRVAGKVRLSAKQKMAVRKMLRKSHGALATMRRAKSVRVRKQMGL